MWTKSSTLGSHGKSWLCGYVPALGMETQDSPWGFLANSLAKLVTRSTSERPHFKTQGGEQLGVGPGLWPLASTQANTHVHTSLLSVNADLFCRFQAWPHALGASGCQGSWSVTSSVLLSLGERDS